MHEPIKFKTVVRADGRWGTVVSISKTNYGIEFTGGEVEYFPHAAVSL